MRTNQTELSAEDKLTVCREVIAELRAQNADLRRFKNRLHNRVRNLFKAKDFLVSFLAEEFYDLDQDEINWDRAPSVMQDPQVRRMFGENGHESPKAKAPG